jgi:hypothetical protein
MIKIREIANECTPYLMSHRAIDILAGSQKSSILEKRQKAKYIQKK